VHTQRLDVADRAAVHAWADAVAAHFGRVNVIINNAGVTVAATIEDTSYENFEWLMNINFWGVVQGSKAFLPHIKKSGDGHIVNVSSLFGLIGVASQAAYNASKFGVRGFTEALREEMEIEGAPVGVTCIHPGGIKTNIAAGGRVIPNASYGLKDSETFGRRFEKLAKTTPDDAAEAIVGAILANKRRLLIGNDAKLLDLVQRLLPTGYQKLLVRQMKQQQLKWKQRG
jgi:NAD(P)-dependent dehydrogenase (short-subunit alcohol dehydrogenase family)